MLDDGNDPSIESNAVTPAPADVPPPEQPRAGQNVVAEIIAPTPVTLRTEHGAAPGGSKAATASLTADALWIQETWQLRRVLLPTLGTIEARRQGRELVLNLLPEAAAERLILTFASVTTGQHWLKKLRAGQEQLAADAPAEDRHVPEGVSLARRAPDVPYVIVGRVAFTGRTPQAADRAVQLQAGMRGADAVIELERRKCAEVGWSARHVSGTAVRVEDAASRQRLRWRWYAEEVGGLLNRLLLLLAVQAALLFLLSVFCAGATRFNGATGETRMEALTSAGLGLGMIYAWPLVLLALLRLLRWPQLLRLTGLAVLAATTVRGLTLLLAHLLALRDAGTVGAGWALWLLVDPVDWAFILIGAALCKRAWRLAGEAADLLPPEAQDVPPGRKAWAGTLLGVTVVQALVCLGFAGTSRYSMSAHVLQPGVDTRREELALLALNEGANLANQGNLEAGERSLLRALRLWEELTAGRLVPSMYRANLSMTLHNLGWVCRQQGRLDEAEKYYARAVAIGDQLAGVHGPDDEFERILSKARQGLAELRGGKSFQLLDEKNQMAVRKYEEAQVQASKGAADAGRLYREAIAAWEEVLPQATNAEYRKDAVVRLATAYLLLAEFHEQQRQLSEGEAALKKSIEYGEKAVAADPERVGPKHNLELARQKLDGLREQALQEEITRLCAAERFADAADRYVRGIEEQEELIRSSKDRDAAVQRLAYRLNRFAWFLAHCPDERVRDTKAAVKHARRATDLQPGVGDYWYTTAMSQYRNGEWRGSLASLEKLKAGEGGYGASDWFLIAMNRHQLQQREEARAALRKGVEWIDERKRQAEDNDVLRLQYEMIRPAIEGLRREAENLLQGKDPANRSVG